MEKAGWLALAVLAVLMTISMTANVWQAGEQAGLSRQFAALNQSYERDKSNWSQERSGLMTQIADMQVNMAGLQAQVQQVMAQRDAQANQASALAVQLNMTSTQLQASRDELDAQKQTVQSLRGDFSRLQSDLNDSLAWFRDNSKLPMSNANAATLSDRVMEDCVDGNELNLACVNYVLTRTATIQYRIDTNNQSMPTNHFQGINGTFAASGGDCKDYSLLLKAILNTARARVAGLHLAAWQAGAGEFRIYPKLSLNARGQYWYFPNSEAVDLGTYDNASAWVICFPYNTQGHCTVAIGGTQGLNGAPPDLRGARVFEPQDGGFMGTIGREFSVCDPSRQFSCWSTQRSIILIIGDNDLYTVQGTKWNGYGSLLSELQNKTV